MSLSSVCFQFLCRLWSSELGHVVPILLQTQQEAEGEFLLSPLPEEECPECNRTDSALHSFILTASRLHHVEGVAVGLAGLWPCSPGSTMVVLTRLHWAALYRYSVYCRYSQLTAVDSLSRGTHFYLHFNKINLLSSMKHRAVTHDVLAASCVLLFNFCCHGDNIPSVDCCPL